MSMNDDTTRARGPGPIRDGGLIGRFWGFEELLGASLIKLVYYIGLFAIAIGVVLAVVGSLLAMGQQGAGALLMVLLAPIGGVLALIYWRFLCEIILLSFLMYDRLGEVRDKLN